MDNVQYKPNLEVVRSARSFIRSLCESYGYEQGMAVWDRVREILGERAACDIFMGMLIGNRVLVRSIGDRKLGAINEVRVISGMALKDAKDFVEDVAYNGPRFIELPDATEDQVRRFVYGMREIGCEVE